MMKNGVISKTIAYYKGAVPEREIKFFEDIIGGESSYITKLKGPLLIKYQDHMFSSVIRREFSCIKCNTQMDELTIMDTKSLLEPYLAYSEDTEDDLYSFLCPQCGGRYVFHSIAYNKGTEFELSITNQYVESEEVTGTNLIDDIYSMKKKVGGDLLYIANMPHGLKMSFEETINEEKEIVHKEIVSVMMFRRF